MPTPSETTLVRALRERIEGLERHIAELEHRNGDLERQILELREAVVALLAPAPAEKSAKFSDNFGGSLPPVSE